MDRREVANFASTAGFGGNQRNTLAVKIETLCAIVEKATAARVSEEMAARVELYDPDDEAVTGRGVLANDLREYAKDLGYDRV